MKINELKKIAKECNYHHEYYENSILHRFKCNFGNYIIIDKLNVGGIRILNDSCEDKHFKMIKASMDFASTPLDERGYTKKSWDFLKLTDKEKEIILKYEKYNEPFYIRNKIFFNLSQEESDKLMKLKRLIVENSKNAEEITLYDENSNEKYNGKEVIVPTSIKDIEKLRKDDNCIGRKNFLYIEETFLKRQKSQIEGCLLYNESKIKEEILEINGEKVKGKNLTLYVADSVLDILSLETKINKHL